MTTIEELRKQAEEIAVSSSSTLPYTPSKLLFRAAAEIESLKAVLGELQKENAELRKQIAELTVKKTQVYKP